MQVVLDFTEEILAGSIFFGMMYITVALNLRKIETEIEGRVQESHLSFCVRFFLLFNILLDFPFIGSPVQNGGASSIGAPRLAFVLFPFWI